MDQLRERSAKRFAEKHPDNLGKEGAVGRSVHEFMWVCVYVCVCVCMDQLRERSAKRLGEKHPDNLGKDGAVGKVRACVYMGMCLRVSHTLLRNKGHMRATSDARISVCDLYICASCSAADVRASVDAPDEMIASSVSRRVFCLAESAGPVDNCM
jgi:hypothetical protein